MARPRKQGLEYFPLDVDFFDDEKIIAISGKYGVTGEIVTLRLLTAIYRSGYFIEWTELLGYKLIRFIDGLTQELLNDIILHLVKCDFFDRQLFEQHNILTSRGIQHRYFHSVSKRTLDDDLPYLLVNTTENKSTNSRRNTPTANASSTNTEKPCAPNTPNTSFHPLTPTSERPLPLSPTYNMTVNEEIKTMLDNKEWCDSLGQINNLSPDEVKLYLRRFATENCDTRHTSIDDARSHVARWIRKVMGSNTTKRNSIVLSAVRNSEAEIRRRRDERQLKERLEREAHNREKQTATEYLKSKGFDPTTNLAELIRNQIAKDESDIENGILPLAGGAVRIRRESSSAQVTEEAPL